jgi:pSer/pThr/pTyr-binding forkhead associated (FHA) protein
MGSTNGTFFEGERITVCLLTHGKTVQLARVAMLFDGENGDAQESGGAPGAYKMSLDEIFHDEKPTSPIPTLFSLDRETETVFVKVTPIGVEKVMKPGPPGAPAPHFEYAGENPQKRVELTGDRITIGKGDTDDVQVKGLLVSREHARVERRPDGRFYLVPLKRFPAVTVNGLKVTEHPLAYDDYIDIGSTRLWFRKGK